MIFKLFHTQLSQGLAACAIAAVIALLVVLLARRRGVEMMGELPLAQLRGILQIVAVGLILAYLLHGSQWIAVPVLGAMMVAAAAIVRDRARMIPRAFTLALLSILVGAGIIVAVTILTGVVPLRLAILIPVGSMLVAQTMNMQSLFLDRLRDDILAHIGEVESALALGASPQTAAMPYISAAFRASLIPSVDNIRSLGIVWIPGLMAGMVLSGSSPVYAALYQFVVLSIIFSAAALTCFTASYLVMGRIFSPEEQLLLRPER
ncbi:MAG TPA: ABC transporter permease [Acidobacteriaceae bacterium]|nr:ABC transporter permease [Acidobacteriaceae bacterium]